MARILRNVGNSAELRKLISQTDIHNQTVSIILDKPRTLEVASKTTRPSELTVRCRDIEERVTVVLHLPFREAAVASATIIDHMQNTESTGV